MDEFKPEDELKPDASDRRPQRSRKTSSAPKVPVSRQYMMMGIGILVLLLLVIGIGSALNSTGNGNQSAQSPASQPPSSSAPTSSGSGDKSIDLSGSSSMSGQSGAQQPAVQAGNSPQELSAPPVSSTPTQAAPVQTPANQQRVELPGDLNNALANQQGQVDNAAQRPQDNASSLPTAPATVVPGASPAATPKAATSQPRQATPPRPVVQHHNKPVSSDKPVVAQPVKEKKSHVAPEAAKTATTSVPRGSYTLQLSSASRSDSLNAWAKKQNLSSYHVYQTTRNGQPWFVLVSGSYATSAEAKHAVASLPAEVRAQNPWVKSVSQVKKEASH
ncbi:SPOR domain-containing protein [Erwinia psidii]|uniref:Cell division protein DamX n=1 Tax=Erwinia psidii TaxID=69224 RepID=A0A3N6RXH5_9GAMM|nr:SPOR domain-containing protein [Erwinia psidii]MCX8958878.1 SPOR domain-containing protein [Erwinia psidii]MCX8961950.1 SPOR domain-containing protein [Erwinia psidii]MCX8966215.1 SPOR domain-containing protein [Erwinia psidii]RQM37804.1 SPOR domain-containing protein [Erwinia psidii]